MINKLFAAFLMDGLREGALWSQDATTMRALARATHRQATLRSPRPSPVVHAFCERLTADKFLWSSQAPAAPTTAYELALAYALRPGPLQFRRTAQLQRAAARILQNAGVTVPEVQIATPTTLEGTGPRIVTVRRALLGGARIISNGTVRDQSWLGALRNLFSV